MRITGMCQSARALSIAIAGTSENLASRIVNCSLAFRGPAGRPKKASSCLGVSLGRNSRRRDDMKVDEEVCWRRRSSASVSDFGVATG